MDYEEAINEEVEQLYLECVNLEDAMTYVEDSIDDLEIDFPNKRRSDLKIDLTTKLKKRFEDG